MGGGRTPREASSSRYHHQDSVFPSSDSTEYAFMSSTSASASAGASVCHRRPDRPSETNLASGNGAGMGLGRSCNWAQGGHIHCWPTCTSTGRAASAEVNASFSRFYRSGLMPSGTTMGTLPRFPPSPSENPQAKFPPHQTRTWEDCGDDDNSTRFAEQNVAPARYASRPPAPTWTIHGSLSNLVLSLTLGRSDRKSVV